MEIRYTFDVEEHGYTLFTMDVEIDGSTDDAQAVAEEKAKEALAQTNPHVAWEDCEVWLSDVHVR